MHFLNVNHLKTWFNLGSCKKNYFNLLLYNSQAVGFQKDRSLWVFNDFEKFPHPWWTAFKPSQPAFLIQPGKSFSCTCARVPDFTCLYDYTFMSVSKNIINWFNLYFVFTENICFCNHFLSFMVHQMEKIRKLSEVGQMQLMPFWFLATV